MLNKIQIGIRLLHLFSNALFYGVVGAWLLDLKIMGPVISLALLYSYACVCYVYGVEVVPDQYAEEESQAACAACEPR